MLMEKAICSSPIPLLHMPTIRPHESTPMSNALHPPTNQHSSLSPLLSLIQPTTESSDQRLNLNRLQTLKL
ncbi:hypothetical protein Csa_010333, partial [Cucumis sativus]